METAVLVPAAMLEPNLRSVENSVPQDWARLAVYLRGQGINLDDGAAPRQFTGGLANLNYLVSIDGGEAVLRRPPLGELPPGAYDMARENRILSRLHERFSLAPRGLHVCEDPAVIGAPFQLTEFRRGFAVRSQLPDVLAGDETIARHLSRTMIDVLVQLHGVDPADVGLDTLGRPNGFLERAVQGWSKRASVAIELIGQPFPAVAAITDWLRGHARPDGAAAFLHNDIKLDNILLDASLEPVAVLDWDQGTRGDALFDLATTLSYWSEAGDPPVMAQLAQMPTASPGFLTRREAAAAYSRATGRDLSDFKFLRVLAMFKLAIIFMQLYARHVQGATADPRYAQFGVLTTGLLDFTWAVANDEFF
ncbi:phosphotransferase family protein [soil metagenome]